MQTLIISHLTSNRQPIERAESLHILDCRSAFLYGFSPVHVADLPGSNFSGIFFFLHVIRNDTSMLSFFCLRIGCCPSVPCDFWAFAKQFSTKLWWEWHILTLTSGILYVNLIGPPERSSQGSKLTTHISSGACGPFTVQGSATPPSILFLKSIF